MFEVIETLDDAEAIAPAWAELRERTAGRVFSDPAWCLTWWRHFHRGRPALAVARRGPALEAVIPLYVRAHYGVRLLRAMGQEFGVTSTVVDPASAPAGTGLWAHVLQRCRRRLDLVAHDSRDASLLSLVGDHPARFLTSVRTTCHVAPARGTFEEYWASRSGKLRQILRRSEREQEQAGEEATVELIQSPEAVAAAMPALVRVFDAGEVANPRQHLLRPPLAGFTIELLGALAARGLLRLFLVRVAGEPAAFLVTVRDGHGLTGWVNRFDPRFSRYSPGHLAVRAAMERVHAEGLDQLDLLLGDQRYKRLWTDETYDALTIWGGGNRVGFDKRWSDLTGAAASQVRQRLHLRAPEPEP